MALLSEETVALWVPQAAGNDALVPSAIDRAQGLAVRYCRRGLEETERQDTLSPPRAATTVSLSTYPIASVELVQTDPLGPSPATVPSEAYVLDAEAGILQFATPLAGGPQSLQVSYTGGYTEETLPGELQEALLRLVAWLIETRGDVGFSSTSQDGVSQTREPLVDGVPESVARMLDAFRSGVTGP